MLKSRIWARNVAHMGEMNALTVHQQKWQICKPNRNKKDKNNGLQYSGYSYKGARIYCKPQEHIIFIIYTKTNFIKF